MTSIEKFCDYLQSLAPLTLAEDWDNVGLLVGDFSIPLHRVMTCLTVTADSADEAIRRNADLVVAHHPLPFRPLKRITSETTPGRLLLQLIANRVAVYSAHTAFDCAADGINEQLARGLEMRGIKPLEEAPEDLAPLGIGRTGEFDRPLRLDEVALRLKRFLNLDHVQVVGASDKTISRAAIACGSAGQFLDSARCAGCDVLVTGETSFHTCLEAHANDVALVLVGHFASERFAMVALADAIHAAYPDLEVWASQCEHDPLRLV